MVVAHFIDVGQGNMVLLQLANGTTMLYDCNITDDNAARVLGYMGAVLPRRGIDIFVNSHREADHMRNVRRVHAALPIVRVWDSGVVGGDTTSAEYREYMDVKRGRDHVVERLTFYDFGTSRVRILNAANPNLPDDPNAQSVVIKVEKRHATTGAVINSLMLTGDSDTRAWERAIVPAYGNQIKSDILLGGHHGSDNFFWRPDNTPYLGHIRAINPRMTIVSVGDNPYGHPALRSLRSYSAFSTGADYVIGAHRATRVLRTDVHGTMRLQLDDDGSWWITWSGPSPRPQVPRRLPAQAPSIFGPSHARRSPLAEAPPVLPRLADILGLPPTPASSKSRLSDLFARSGQLPSLGLGHVPSAPDIDEILKSLASPPPWPRFSK